MSCDDQWLQQSVYHQHAKDDLHRHDYCRYYRGFSSWRDVLDCKSGGGEDETSSNHYHHAVIVLKKVSLRRQVKAVWAERPVRAGQPLTRR